MADGPDAAILSRTMHKVLAACGMCCVIVAIGVRAGAQAPQGPAWAYGFPPADAAPAPRGSSPAVAVAPDTTPKQIPAKPASMAHTRWCLARTK